jgi:hypothetical protein
LSSKQTTCAVVLIQLSQSNALSITHSETYLPNLCQLVIVLKEEAQVLIADVDVCIPAKPSVLFLRLATTAEPMAVNLILDLIRGIVHVYARADVRCAHLCLRPLQRGEELGVQQGRLRVSQLVRHVTRQAEIRILVDRTWDEAGNVGLGAKDLWEGVGKGRRSLDGGKVYLADVVTRKTKNVPAGMSQDKKRGTEKVWGRNVRVVETKRRLCLAEGDLARDVRHVLVKLAADEVVIAENERLFELEPDGDDVPRVPQRKLVSLLRFKLMLEQEFFVI